MSIQNAKEHDVLAPPFFLFLPCCVPSTPGSKPTATASSPPLLHDSDSERPARTPIYSRSHRMASSSSFALDFLRRLLCAHNTGGSADVAPRDAPGHLLSAPEPDGRSPCIVARLMGLDAMPAPPAQPLRRSRSASSAEGGRSPYGPGGAAPRPPAPVRASASLREKPAYLRAENDMFLLLSFSPEERGTAKKADDEGEERRREDGPLKQRRGHRRKLQFGGDDGAVESSSGRRECNAQSSSPVSVLEARDVHEESSTTTTSSSLEDAEPCSATSEEAHFALEQQSATRKLHTSFVQLDEVSPATSIVHASGYSDRDRRNRRTVNKSEVNTPDVTSIWQPICGLVGEDLKNMEWLTRDDDANLVGEMDSEILDQLICEATVELIQLSSATSPFSYAPKMFSQDEQSEAPISKKHSSKAIIGGS